MLAMAASWFTPTALFVTINIVIATIVIISLISHQKQPPAPPLGALNSAQLGRPPSLLSRVQSFNFSFLSLDGHANSDEFRSDGPNQLVRTPSILNRLMSGNLSSLYRSEQIPYLETETRDLKPNPEQKITQEVKRRNSDSGEEVPATAPEKMAKSASEKMGKRQAEEIEKRRPSTVRADKRGSIVDFEEEIDAKADDFINKFKQQLKLQRLDSLLRYRDMLKGK